MITITIDTKKFKKFMGKIPRAMGEAAYAWTKVARDSIRKQYLISPKRSVSRGQSAVNIRAVKVRQNLSTVIMPQKLFFLDSMKPHYVSLKRGRAITRWARQNFSGRVVSGKSKVSISPQGVRRGSQLYVTPDPFILKGFVRIQGRFSKIINKKLRRLSLIGI